MTFQYSKRRLRDRLIIRFLPSLIFLFFALLFGKIFWWAVGFIWLEMLVEVYLLNHFGYFKTEGPSIRLLNPINPKEIEMKDVRRVFDYEGEITFWTGLKEIRINRKYIKENQLPEFEKWLEEHRRIKS